MKISNIVILIVAVIIIVAIGGYFGGKYYLSAQGPEYLLMHPTIAKIFQVSAVCPTVCIANGGVCGKDGKNYCNQCLAFQHGAGYAHDGVCIPAGWKPAGVSWPPSEPTEVPTHKLHARGCRQFRY